MSRCTHEPFFGKNSLTRVNGACKNVVVPMSLGLPVEVTAAYLALPTRSSNFFSRRSPASPIAWAKSASRAVLIFCRGILSACHGKIKVSRAMLSGCHGILFPSHAALFSCQAVMSDCHAVLFSCRGVLFLCQGTLFFCHGCLFSTAYEESVFSAAATGQKTTLLIYTTANHANHARKPSRSRIPRISRSFPFFIAKRREIQFAADAEWPAVLKERVEKILAAHTDKTGKFIECTSVCYEITGGKQTMKTQVASGGFLQHC